ncbi:DMP19 family protein [Paenibacillus lutrae]|uniref:DNA mimic protein DMP19 C-terminal domain-containing protein n=1 Tax=Paenibacillus lutrae TaxID=2078573 RepID=A0A7X3FH27_9BACL|nr:hypothetical protein [Paenibacillus lutrae]MVO99530.1 hypothetical protein [Paenibacillus lutrae]
MNELKPILSRLIPVHDGILRSGEDIVEHIAIRLYDNDCRKLGLYLNQIPLVLKDIVLVIDMDTEMNMNGILGFLENSTGLYLNETIEALDRMEAFRDANCLRNIRAILLAYGIQLHARRVGTSHQDLYEVSSGDKPQGTLLKEAAGAIEAEASRMYLYSEHENLFDHVFLYAEKNKYVLYEQVNRIMLAANFT